MAGIVNLRHARKARARAADETQAAVNRAAFGRTRQARVAAETELARTRDVLDGARRESTE